jgi:hypothetical protein
MLGHQSGLQNRFVLHPRVFASINTVLERAMGFVVCRPAGVDGSRGLSSLRKTHGVTATYIKP